MSKKLMFFEIGEGEFAEEVQRSFEEGQAIVAKRGCKVTLSMEIVIFPENQDRKGTCTVEFKSALKAPAKKSIPFITELEKGVMVDSGHRQVGIFAKNEPEAAGKTTPFSTKAGNA